MSHLWNHVIAPLDYIDSRRFGRIELLTPKVKVRTGQSIGGYKVHFTGGPDTTALNVALTTACENPDNDGVMLSFVNVGHLNSLGLSVFVKAAYLAAKHNKYFALTSLDPRVVNIFVISKLRLVIKDFVSVDQAIDDYETTRQPRSKGGR